MSATCSICTSDKAGAINSFLAAGRSPNWIENEMKRVGTPTKAETVRRHRERCLNGDSQNAVLAGAMATGGHGMGREDFAHAVRAVAHQKLEEGTLSVRAEHGLQAQALLDRRAEKAADRQLMTDMALLLSGARPEAGPPQELVIEGEWSEIEPLAPLALVARD